MGKHFGKRHVHIRPDWNGPAGPNQGWAVDHYSGSGRWEGSSYFDTKDAAQKDAARVRRLYRKSKNGGDRG